MQNLHRLALIAAGAFAALDASATSLVKLSFATIVDQSSAVVVGEAVASRTENTQNGLMTYTTLKVDHWVVGAGAETIEVAVPGGDFKPGKFRVSERTADAPVFLNGSQSLLFLETISTGDLCVVGFSQGVSAVVSTPEGQFVTLPDADSAQALESAIDVIRAERASL